MPILCDFCFHWQVIYAKEERAISNKQHSHCLQLLHGRSIKLHGLWSKINITNSLWNLLLKIFMEWSVFNEWMVIRLQFFLPTCWLFKQSQSIESKFMLYLYDLDKKLKSSVIWRWLVFVGYFIYQNLLSCWTRHFLLCEKNSIRSLFYTFFIMVTLFNK